MNPIRFGVIGLKRGRSFVRVCRAVGGVAVTALFDVDVSRAERAAAEIGAPAFGYSWLQTELRRCFADRAVIVLNLTGGYDRGYLPRAPHYDHEDSMRSGKRPMRGAPWSGWRMPPNRASSSTCLRRMRARARSSKSTGA